MILLSFLDITKQKFSYIVKLKKILVYDIIKKIHKIPKWEFYVIIKVCLYRSRYWWKISEMKKLSMIYKRWCI